LKEFDDKINTLKTTNEEIDNKMKENITIFESFENKITKVEE